MTQASIDCRNMWAERIERCLSSSMSIERWCKLNHVGRSSLYAWLARFREEELGRFPRRNAATLNWIELTRGGLADSKAIVPAGTFSDDTAVSSVYITAASQRAAFAGSIAPATPIPGSNSTV